MYLNSMGVRLTRNSHAGSPNSHHVTAAIHRWPNDPEMLARTDRLAAVMVANASRTIGDQALEIKRQTESDFRIAVIERIREIAGNRVRENETVRGESAEPTAFLASYWTQPQLPSRFCDAIAKPRISSYSLCRVLDIQKAHERWTVSPFMTRTVTSDRKIIV